MDKEKIKKFVKDHKVEIAFVGSGIIIGVVAIRAYNKRAVNNAVKEINRHLADAFFEKQGNFQLPDGYDVLQMERK